MDIDPEAFAAVLWGIERGAEGLQRVKAKNRIYQVSSTSCTVGNWDFFLSQEDLVTIGISQKHSLVFLSAEGEGKSWISGLGAFLERKEREWDCWPKMELTNGVSVVQPHRHHVPRVHLVLVSFPSIIVPNLQMRLGRLREIKWLGHRNPTIGKSKPCWTDPKACPQYHRQFMFVSLLIHLLIRQCANFICFSYFTSQCR